MKSIPRREFLASIAVAASALSGTQVSASTGSLPYPTMPVRIVVPFPAGGPADSLGRLLAAELSTRLGQPFIVDNKAGAGGNIGSAEVAKSKPDGYTLLLGSVGTQAINKSLYSSLGYDPQKSFSPISLIADVSNVMVVNADIAKSRGIDSVASFISWAKAHPGTLNAGSAGAGSSAHLALAQFNALAKVDIRHVPYRGSGPAVIDLLGGTADLIFDNPMSSMPHVKAGKLKALGVTGAKRVPAFPDIPTVAEAGPLPGFSIDTWFGLLAPAGTPSPTVKKLNEAIAAAINSPIVKKRLEEQGARPVTNSPDEFSRLIESELQRWAAIVKTSGAKAD